LGGDTDYVIFLTILYGIIFQWSSSTHYSDQNMSVEDEFFFQEVIESAITPPDLNAMEWFHPCPLCWV
jgi:hypothetical protein